jgi:hypothetical protein
MIVDLLGISTEREMTCKKIAYKNEISAMLALAQCRNSRKRRRMEVRAYFCPICKKWHLTSKKIMES